MRAFVGRDAERFGAVAHSFDEHGTPILDEWIALLVCRLDRVVEAGDHEILIGEVERCERHERPPLLFHDSRFHELPQPAGDPDGGRPCPRTTSCTTSPIPSSACSCPAADRAAPAGPGTELGGRSARGQVDTHAARSC